MMALKLIEQTKKLVLRLSLLAVGAAASSSTALIRAEKDPMGFSFTIGGERLRWERNPDYNPDGDVDVKEYFGGVESIPMLHSAGGVLGYKNNFFHVKVDLLGLTLIQHWKAVESNTFKEERAFLCLQNNCAISQLHFDLPLPLENARIAIGSVDKKWGVQVDLGNLTKSFGLGLFVGNNLSPLLFENEFKKKKLKDILFSLFNLGLKLEHDYADMELDLGYLESKSAWNDFFRGARFKIKKNVLNYAGMGAYVRDITLCYWSADKFTGYDIFDTAFFKDKPLTSFSLSSEELKLPYDFALSGKICFFTYEGKKGSTYHLVSIPTCKKEEGRAYLVRIPLTVSWKKNIKGFLNFDFDYARGWKPDMSLGFTFQLFPWFSDQTEEATA